MTQTCQWCQHFRDASISLIPTFQCHQKINDANTSVTPSPQWRQQLSDANMSVMAIFLWRQHFSDTNTLLKLTFVWTPTRSLISQWTPTLHDANNCVNTDTVTNWFIPPTASCGTRESSDLWKKYNSEIPSNTLQLLIFLHLWARISEYH